MCVDEIGESERELQAKLLQVMRQRAVTPLGTHLEAPVDVRVIAASNRDLRQAVAEGQFRESLYYRPNVLSLHTIPLQRRPRGIEPLAPHEPQFQANYKQTQKRGTVHVTPSI